MCDHPALRYISMCCSVKLSVVGELKSSPLMFYLCILQPPVSPPSSFSLISPVFGDKRELRVAVELQTGCHGDCQRLCVCVCMCVSHAIMEAVSEPRRLTVSCLSDCWRQNDQRCCFRTAICLTASLNDSGYVAICSQSFVCRSCETPHRSSIDVSSEI